MSAGCSSRLPPGHKVYIFTPSLIIIVQLVVHSLEYLFCSFLYLIRFIVCLRPREFHVYFSSRHSFAAFHDLCIHSGCPFFYSRMRMPHCCRLKFFRVTRNATAIVRDADFTKNDMQITASQQLRKRRGLIECAETAREYVRRQFYPYNFLNRRQCGRIGTFQRSSCVKTIMMGTYVRYTTESESSGAS